MDNKKCCIDLSSQTPIHLSSTDASANTGANGTVQYQTKQFANEKKQTLAKMDKSVKGAIDEPIVDLVEMINNSPQYYTTSSCSGRIIVTASNTAGDQENGTIPVVVKKGTDWQFVSHEPIDNVDHFVSTFLDEVQNHNGKAHDSMIIKFEPVIFHIRASDIESARCLLQVGLQSGFRNSGIVLSAKGRATVAFRSTAALEAPLIIDGELVASEEYLRHLTKVSNRKMVSNAQAIKRLQLALERFLKGNNT